MKGGVTLGEGVSPESQPVSALIPKGSRGLAEEALSEPLKTPCTIICCSVFHSGEATLAPLPGGRLLSIALSVVVIFSQAKPQRT